MSHPWGAIGLLGLQEYVLDVQPLAPQFAQVQIKPLWVGNKLQRANGKVPTERGDIELKWWRENGRFHLQLTLPTNITANVYLPIAPDKHAFVGEVGSGKHQFEEGDCPR